MSVDQQLLVLVDADEIDARHPGHPLAGSASDEWTRPFRPSPDSSPTVPAGVDGRPAPP